MAEQAGDRVRLLERPGKLLFDDGAGWGRGVDRAGGDVGDGARRGQPYLGAVEPVLPAQQVDQVDDVVGIDDRHVLQPQMLRVLGDDAVRDGMERAAHNALRSLRVAAHDRSARERALADAARRVNVNSRIRSGTTPASSRHATQLR